MSRSKTWTCSPWRHPIRQRSHRVTNAKQGAYVGPLLNRSWDIATARSRSPHPSSHMVPPHSVPFLPCAVGFRSMINPQRHHPLSATGDCDAGAADTTCGPLWPARGVSARTASRRDSRRGRLAGRFCRWWCVGWPPRRRAPRRPRSGHGGGRPRRGWRC